ncbi:MAG: hypothetical protein AAGK22_10030 [Acidobacteriota bacterium]
MRLVRTASIVCLLLLLPAVALASSTADKEGAPTFYGDVLSVLQENCQVCHREGGSNLGGMVAPMAFVDYKSTRPWAKSIARQVEAKLMPPWHASEDQHGIFANERTLKQEDMDLLISWAKAGAPEGNPADAPPTKEWPQTAGWSIGEPDIVLDMGTKYFIEDNVDDQYITFETEITEDILSEPRWVQAVEFRPGSSVVHHIIAAPLGGIAPGNDPTYYNDGYGTLLEPGTKIRWQMHYHKEPGPDTGVWDKSYAALKFYPKGYTPEHVVVNNPLVRADWVIPAGAENHQEVVTTKFERETLLLGYTPHMHLRGKSARYVAKYPDGSEEVLLEVPKYDFNWQTHYEYPAPGKRVPAGTEIELTMAWDNSANNPNNPDPTVDVRHGQPTTAEMMFGFVNYTDAEPGYMPKAGEGFFGSREARMKRMLKDRFGLDWDTMSDEERKAAIEKLRARRRSRDAAGD